MHMPNELGAALIVEIGSVTTRVTLVDSVAGETRMIGQAEAPSTTEPPYEDAVVAVLEATERVADLTGRRLLQDGNLLTPQTNERDGINSVVVITSAAGQMSLVIAAIASDISARSALHASRATYSSVLQVITLNDAADTITPQQASWIEQQVQSLLSLRPDMVLIAGGLEDGAEDALARLAHIIGLTTSARVSASGPLRQDTTPLPVIFAGNSRSRERVIEALSPRTNLRIVDNVRPTLEREWLEPARRELSKQYDEEILTRLPGLPSLRRLSRTRIRTACEAAGLMTRFLSQQYGHDTLTLDAGSANTAALLHSERHYSPAVLGGVGTGYGIGALIAEVGLAAIARWLPFPITQHELMHRLLNKMLRPYGVPTTREDVLLEHAVAREALTLALSALWEERPDSAYSMVVGCGGVLAHAPHPGFAALTLLDVLQPDPARGVAAVNLHLDTLGLMGACGALTYASADASLTLFERDLLGNTPLGLCIISQSGGRFGEKGIDAELQIVGGAQQRVTVPYGQIGRLELPPGRKAELTVRVGRGVPGAELTTDIAAIEGSALGVVIDARGRPLRLPDSPRDRQQALWDWLAALGAVSGSLPYETAAPLHELLLDSPAPLPSRGSKLVNVPPVPPTPPPIPSSEPSSLDADLARLRQTVEQPKKRGLFGRK
jgi:hypothetical protein